jgi:energy-converting hydrogenase Eha subunit E
MVAKLSRIAVVIGMVGVALTYFGMLSILPLMTWVGVAVVGAIATLIFRRPSD